MKHILALLAIFIFHSHAHAVTTVETFVEVEFLRREFIIQDCEYVDYFLETTRTVYTVSYVNYTPPGKTQQDGEGYVAKPNPCLDDEHAAVFFQRPDIDKARAEWCTAPEYTPTLGGAGPVYRWDDQSWQTVTYRDYQERISKCDDCHIPTPEPSTIVFFLSAIGWLLCFSALGKSAWNKVCGHTVCQHKTAGEEK